MPLTGEGRLRKNTSRKRSSPIDETSSRIVQNANISAISHTAINKKRGSAIP
jgi:hypothetical protein